MKIDELSEGKIGKEVVYIPTHANGDVSHPDCEVGVISSYNGKYVFVKYWSNVLNKYKDTPQATCPEDLVMTKCKGI